MGDQSPPHGDRTRGIACLAAKDYGRYDRYMASHTGLLKKPVTVSVVCVGYEFGFPVVFPSDVHFANFTKPYATSLAPDFTRGLVGAFSPFGQREVCNELITGTSPLLSRYRKKAIIQKYVQLKSKGKTAELTTNEFIELSKVCLEATESPSGRRFDPNAKVCRTSERLRSNFRQRRVSPSLYPLNLAFGNHADPLSGIAHKPRGADGCFQILRA